MNRSRRYPYASSVSSSDSVLHPAAGRSKQSGNQLQQHQHQSLISTRKKRKYLRQQAALAAEADNELEVTFCGQVYRLSGLGSLDPDTLCRDLIYALVWFQWGGKVASCPRCCGSQESAASFDCLQLESRRYEMIVEFPENLKRVRDSLPVERLLRRLRRHRQRYRLRVRPRRLRRVTFELEDNSARNTAAAEGGPKDSHRTEPGDGEEADDSGKLIRDWMRRLNLGNFNLVPADLAGESPGRKHQVLEVRLLSTTTTLMAASDCPLNGGCSADSDTGVSSMAASDSDRLHQHCPHQRRLCLQRPQLQSRRRKQQPTQGFQLYLTECLTDCDTPDIAYFATLV